MDNTEDGLGRLCSDSSDSSDSETESDEDAHGDDDVEDADMEEDTPPETLPAVALGEVRPGSLVAYMVQQNRQSDPATGGEEGHIGMRQADIVVGANIEFLPCSPPTFAKFTSRGRISGRTGTGRALILFVESCTECPCVRSKT